MFGEIGFRGAGARGPHLRQAGQVRRLPQGFRCRRPQPVEQGEERRDPILPREAQEHPIALLAPFDQARFAKDADMARHARLALPHDLCDLAHGQFHRPQQVDDAQPCRIAKRPENVESGVHDGII